MPILPIGASEYNESFGAGATSRGTAVTANASANTKGSYTQLLAASRYTADGIWINFDDQASSSQFLVDIAIGAASSEKIILANLSSCTGAITISYGQGYYFPLRIPKGSRIAARCQSLAGGGAINVSGMLTVANNFFPASGQHVVTYGANTGDSGGVNVDPGGSANTKGSYSEITSATTHPISFLQIGIGMGGNIVRSSCSWRVDLAVGAAGSEKIVIADFVLNLHQTPDIITPLMLPFWRKIPKGSRIAMRASCSITDASDRLFDAFVYGAA